MRGLKRDQKSFEYFPCIGKGSDLNEDGDHTGTPAPVYGSPVTYHGSISAASGHTNPTFYGRDLRYTHVLVMTNMKAEIHEDGYILWKGKKYEVRAVADTVNVKSIALRQMTVDQQEITIPDDDEETPIPDEEEEIQIPDGDEP